jgi:hypothetical protein
MSLDPPVMIPARSMQVLAVELLEVALHAVARHVVTEGVFHRA